MLGGLGQHSESVFAVELPLAAELVVVLGIANVAGVERVGSDAAAAARRVAIQPDAVEFDGYGVARHGAFDVERAGLGIASVRAALVFRVAAAGVNCGASDSVARVDVERRRNGSGEEAVERRGRE